MNVLAGDSSPSPSSGHKNGCIGVTEERLQPSDGERGSLDAFIVPCVTWRHRHAATSVAQSICASSCRCCAVVVALKVLLSYKDYLPARGDQGGVDAPLFQLCPYPSCMA